jgi:hypothetical protein
VNIDPVDNVDKPVNNHDKASPNVNKPMDNSISMPELYVNQITCALTKFSVTPLNKYSPV